MSEMVERVAQAICDATGEFAWEKEDEAIRSEFRKEAVHAIAAMREPTEAMLKAGDLPGWDDSVTCDLGGEIWAAMVDAALEIPDAARRNL